MQLLREWQQRAQEALDNSDISPQARRSTKQYLKEQAELHEALDQDDAHEEAEEFTQEQKEDNKAHIIECWQKVDELEQALYDTYLNADDGAYGQTLYKQAKRHLSQQKRECAKLDGERKEARRTAKAIQQQVL